MIAIIKYNAGNIRSVQNALSRLGYESKLTDDVEEIRAADKVIIPGVGEASSAMQYLKARSFDSVIPTLEQPVLGICLGLQLLCKGSDEGDTNCVGIFDSMVRKFPPTQIVPQMGWNNLSQIKGNLMKEITTQDDVYFVHSYYAELCSDTVAQCDYIVPFSAALQKKNFYATQFHPEKSGSVGEQILRNFLAI